MLVNFAKFQIIKTLIFVIVIIFFMNTCDKDGPVVDIPIIPKDTSFCGYINAEKFDKTQWQIDSFLMSLPRNDDIKSIDSLVVWLKLTKSIIPFGNCIRQLVSLLAIITSEYNNKVIFELSLF